VSTTLTNLPEAVASRLLVFLEVAREALKDAELFDKMASRLDLSDEEMGAARDALDDYLSGGDEIRHCPWCSTVVPRDSSKLPHNEDGQPYCSGRCYDRALRSAGIEPDADDACGDQCVDHAPGCDGFCDHLEGHVNACLKYGDAR
jgi:hypothetical protein